MSDREVTAVPIKGKGVKRTGSFAEIERLIIGHGFRHGAPNRWPSPGFYFYSRGAWVIQICHGRTLTITGPKGRPEGLSVVSTKNLSKLDSILDELVLDIEEDAEENT
jgi:hypothetical protein